MDRPPRMMQAVTQPHQIGAFWLVILGVDIRGKVIREEEETRGGAVDDPGEWKIKLFKRLSCLTPDTR